MFVARRGEQSGLTAVYTDGIQVDEHLGRLHCCGQALHNRHAVNGAQTLIDQKHVELVASHEKRTGAEFNRDVGCILKTRSWLPVRI